MQGERQRTAILDALREAPGGLDTHALAELIGLHANTLRWHLGLLAEDGLVSSAPTAANGPGRPRIVYRLTPDGVAHDRDEYRLLATMLTRAVATGDGAYETGVRWGRDAQAGEGETDVAALLDRQGFAARTSGNRIEMRRCPFYALAEACPQVVCELHRGFIDGALAGPESPQRVSRLDVFVEPALCVAELSER